MATGNFYRGTSQTQDARFSNKDKKLLNSREWPPEFDLKVNMKKVEINAIKPWIQKRITDILGFEDEVVINLAISELESKDEKGPCPKKIQLNLTGFLTNKASIFMKELWKLLLEAQDTPNGIPPSLIQERKEEILQKKEDLINQEAKLESIRAFLKQAGEEIKSKLNNKKPNEREKDETGEKKGKHGNFDKIERVLTEDSKQEKTKDKNQNDIKKNKRDEHKDHSHRSKSRSRSKSHHHKKNRQNKNKDDHRHTKKYKRSRSHSKEIKKEKPLEIEESEEKKIEKKNLNVKQHEVKNGSDAKKKVASSSSGSEDSGSSDESSPISEASSD